MATREECVFLNDQVNSGAIINATRKELEKYAIWAAHPNMPTVVGQIQRGEVGQTIRLLLSLRISEDAQNDAMHVATTALKVSRIALYVVIAQAVLALPPFVETVRTWSSSSPQQLSATQPPQSTSAVLGAE